MDIDGIPYCIFSDLAAGLISATMMQKENTVKNIRSLEWQPSSGDFKLEATELMPSPQILESSHHALCLTI